MKTDFGDLLRRAASMHRLRTERSLAEFGMTAGQFSVLAIVVDRPSVSSADVARIEGLTPQTISVIVANLIKRGAVVRLPHAVHGRIQRLEASVAGLELFALCDERVQRLEERLRREMSQPDRLTVRRWLAGVAA
jgi:DNA-binding MarR family transcriptional regulator